MGDSLLNTYRAVKRIAHVPGLDRNQMFWDIWRQAAAYVVNLVSEAGKQNKSQKSAETEKGRRATTTERRTDDLPRAGSERASESGLTESAVSAKLYGSC